MHLANTGTFGIGIFVWQLGEGGSVDETYLNGIYPFVCLRLHRIVDVQRSHSTGVIMGKVVYLEEERGFEVKRYPTTLETLQHAIDLIVAIETTHNTLADNLLADAMLALLNSKNILEVQHYRGGGI